MKSTDFYINSMYTVLYVLYIQIKWGGTLIWDTLYNINFGKGNITFLKSKQLFEIYIRK